jgi:hypothetical protein
MCRLHEVTCTEQSPPHDQKQQVQQLQKQRFVKLYSNACATAAATAAAAAQEICALAVAVRSYLSRCLLCLVNIYASRVI